MQSQDKDQQIKDLAERLYQKLTEPNPVQSHWDPDRQAKELSKVVGAAITETCRQGFSIKGSPDQPRDSQGRWTAGNNDKGRQARQNLIDWHLRQRAEKRRDLSKGKPTKLHEHDQGLIEHSIQWHFPTIPRNSNDQTGPEPSLTGLLSGQKLEPPPIKLEDPSTPNGKAQVENWRRYMDAVIEAGMVGDDPNQVKRPDTVNPRFKGHLGTPSLERFNDLAKKYDIDSIMAAIRKAAKDNGYGYKISDRQKLSGIPEYEKYDPSGY
jgi:hypothetical protein